MKFNNINLPLKKCPRCGNNIIEETIDGIQYMEPFCMCGISIKFFNPKEISFNGFMMWKWANEKNSGKESYKKIVNEYMEDNQNES